MTGTLCIYIHLDIGSVYINNACQSRSCPCLNSATIQPVIFQKTDIPSGSGGRLKCLPQGASDVDSDVTPLLVMISNKSVSICSRFHARRIN